MTSPKSTDYDRIAQKLYELHGNDIFTREDFDGFFFDYMQDNIDNFKDDDKVREKSWEYYKKSKNIPERTKKRVRKIEMERRMIKKRYVKKLVEQKPRKARVRKFVYAGKQKNRTVYARKIKTKQGVRYVDIKGRRVSVKRKKLHHSKTAIRKKHKTKTRVRTRQKRRIS